jgi:protein FAM32A
MPSDDYAVAAGGGALKLKGFKVSKKKKKKDKSDLEKNLGKEVVKKDKSPSHDHREPDEEREDGEEPTTDAHKTESERRHDELRKKRVSQTYSGDLIHQTLLTIVYSCLL